MTWALVVFGGVAGLLLNILHKLFLEVRAIRIMMNRDRGIDTKI